MSGLGRGTGETDEAFAVEATEWATECGMLVSLVGVLCC